MNKTDSDFYRVEEVLRSRMRNKRKEYFVKWMGYPDKFNYWVPAESVKDIKLMYLKLISCGHLCVGLQYGNTVLSHVTEQ